MPTAIINPIYLLCSILFEINMLFLVSSHINVEQFLGLTITKDYMIIRKNYPQDKVGLGKIKKTDSVELPYKHVKTF